VPCHPITVLPMLWLALCFNMQSSDTHSWHAGCRRVCTCHATVAVTVCVVSVTHRALLLLQPVSSSDSQLHGALLNGPLQGRHRHTHTGRFWGFGQGIKGLVTVYAFLKAKARCVTAVNYCSRPCRGVV